MDWAIDILKAYGLAGVVIAALAYVVKSQNTQLRELQQERLDEAKALTKALEQNTAAFNDNARATEARNEITQELGEAIGRQAAALELFTQRADLRSEAMRDQLAAQKMAMDALSESNRVNTGIITDIRNRVT